MSTYVSRNPARFDDVVTEVPLATSADVLAACEAAHAAQAGWAAVPAPFRGRVIAQVGRLFEANKESLSRLVTREMGKVYAEALGDVQEVIDTCDFFLGEGRRLYGQTVPSEMPDKQLFTFRMPVGTAMIITAGNFPAAVPSWYIVPALVTGNTIFRARTRGVGVLSKEDAISYGCSGPTARASGVDCDIRKVQPYGIYDRIDFQQIIGTEGDTYSRYLVRMQEMRQSLHIIEQLIDNIPEGDFQAKTKAVLKVPKGEYYSRVETARGDFGVYLVSEGGLTPYRIKYRSPGFSNLSALDHTVRGQKIGDLVAIMGSFDLVIPDIDR